MPNRELSVVVMPNGALQTEWIEAKENINKSSRLLQESDGLAFIKNKWVAVDPEKLKQTLDAYEKAKKIIEQFQGPAYVPFMVLSLKAGGVGLNLTEANHVIHFDRCRKPCTMPHRNYPKDVALNFIKKTVWRYDQPPGRGVPEIRVWYGYVNVLDMR